MTTITENNVGWRFVQYMKVGDEYSVRTIGDTIGAVWTASGAIIGGQSLPDIGRRFVCLAPGNGTGTVEDLQLNLNATLGPISGTVAVSNFPAVQPVTGTFFQATQPVSGSVSVSSLPAIGITNTSFDVSNFPASQPVTGTFFQATQPVSGSVSVSSLPAIGITNTSFDVSNFPASQPVTGTFFQATQPVSGSVSVSSLPAIGITNTSFDVSNFPASQPVTGTFFQATQPVSGTVSVDNFTPLASANIRTASELIVGNWFKVESLGNTIGAVWNACGAIIGSEPNPPIGRVFKCLSNGNGTGTVSTIIYNENVEVSNFPASQPVTGTFFQATQPVSGSVSVSSLPAIGITNTSFDVSNFPASQPVTGTFFQATQPVSGTFFQATQPVSGSVGVNNFTPDGPANTLSVSDIIAGQWYKVEFLGDTVSAEWIAMGATFTAETFPAVSRVFKALTDGNGTGTVSVIIYNEHVTVDNAVLEVNIASQTAPVSVDISSSIGLDIANLPPIAITNIGFEVTNIPHVIVDTLPPIAITNIGFEVTNIPNVVVDTLPPIAITNIGFEVTNIPHVTVDNAVLEVNIASQTAPVVVDITSSIGLDIANLPAIAITNTSFAVTNTNATAIAVKPVASGFAATITGPVTTIDTTTAVSRTTIDLTSHQIKASGSGTITTMTLSSNLLAATLGTINFVKFYNLPTATQTDTPILKVGLLSNQSLTIDANISFTNGCCVRASNLWADSDTTVPTENITGAFFLRV